VYGIFSSFLLHKRTACALSDREWQAVCRN